MARRKTVGRGFLVGFGKREITPPSPFPMAGMAGRTERLAERVRDPLQARALAFGDGQAVALVVSADLLLITSVLREAVEKRLREDGVAYEGLLLTATHTHSSTGGYWDVPSARLFMGRYRPEIFASLVEKIAAAAAAAVGDLSPADLSFGETQTTYLNYNRRHAEGPVDRALGVLDIKRQAGDVGVVFFGAHPVVVGFRDYHTASADYPGELIGSIEADGGAGMFVVGPVGGVNVLFPEGPLDTDVHLALLARLMREEVDRARAAAAPVEPGPVAFASAGMSVEIAMPRLLPDRLAWADALLYPLRLWVRRFARRGLTEGHTTSVPVVRVGNLVFTGFPADLGAGVGLAARRLIEERSLRAAVVASQTGDYVGYVHLPPEYQQFDGGDLSTLWLNVYENGMSFGGRQVGRRLLETLAKALAEV